MVWKTHFLILKNVDTCFVHARHLDHCAAKVAPSDASGPVVNETAKMAALRRAANNAAENEVTAFSVGSPFPSLLQYCTVLLSPSPVTALLKGALACYDR